MTENSNAPYSPEEIQHIAAAYVARRSIPESHREDAESEFVLAALEAARNASSLEGIRAYQHRAGEWAVSSFLRRDIRTQQRFGAGTDSLLDESDEDGEGDFLENTLVSDPADDPLAQCMAAERAELVRAALATLPERDRKLLELVVIEGKSLAEGAKAVGLKPCRAALIRNRALDRLRIGLGGTEEDWLG